MDFLEPRAIQGKLDPKVRNTAAERLIIKGECTLSYFSKFNLFIFAPLAKGKPMDRIAEKDIFTQYLLDPLSDRNQT